MYICFFMLIIFSLQIFVLHLFALSIKGFLQTCIMQCFSCIYLLWSQVLFLQTRIMQCLPDPFHQQWPATPIQTRRPLSSISIKSQPNF